MADPTIYGNGTTTATGGENTITHFYDRAGIEAANAKSVYAQFASKKSMPQKYGKTFKISKWEHIYDLSSEDSDFASNGYLGKRDLNEVTTNLANTGMSGALAEGAGSVNKVSPKKVTVSTEVARYGFMTEYTDEVVAFSEDTVQTIYREELGALMGQVNEELIQADMLNNAGIVINAGGDITKAEMGAVTDAAIEADDTNADLYTVSYDLIRKGVKALKRNRAQMNTEIVTGSVKIGTQPISAAYYAIVGPEVKYDLESLTRGSGYAEEYAYVPAHEYAAAGNLAEGEIGRMHDVRFIYSEGALIEKAAGGTVPVDYAGVLSASGGTDNSSATESDRDNFDVFPILFPTKDAFATVGLKGKGKIQFHSKSPMDTDLTNPYGTKGFFSANMFYAGIALQPEKLLRINVLATA